MVAYVFNVPVGTLIATSGVFAVILGLALQSTLADVFSGIALNLSKPYGVGDWLSLGNGIEGKVVETNWRATYLINGANDLVIVPNSDLAKARLTNLSSPQRTHGVTLHHPHGADEGAVGHFGCHAHGASQQQFHLAQIPPPQWRSKSMDAQGIQFRNCCSASGIFRRWRLGLSMRCINPIYRHAKAAELAARSNPREALAAFLLAIPAAGACTGAAVRRHCGCWTPSPCSPP